MVELAAQPDARHAGREVQTLIADYNAGSLNVERLFDELLKFVAELDAEDSRAVREGLTEEELAILDILTKPEPALSAAEHDLVEQVAGRCSKRSSAKSWFSTGV